MLAQLEIFYTDGTTDRVTTGGNSRWTAIGADEYRRPTIPSVGVPGLSATTAYAKILENVDASQETLEWRTAVTMPTRWPAAVASAYQARDQLIPRMSRPVVVFKPNPPTVSLGATDQSFLVDFGRNFQGGQTLDHCL